MHIFLAQVVFASFCHFCHKVFAMPVITGFCHWFFPLWQKLANPESFPSQACADSCRPQWHPRHLGNVILWKKSTTKDLSFLFLHPQVLQIHLSRTNLTIAILKYTTLILIHYLHTRWNVIHTPDRRSSSTGISRRDFRFMLWWRGLFTALPFALECGYKLLLFKWLPWFLCFVLGSGLFACILFTNSPP